MRWLPPAALLIFALGPFPVSLSAQTSLLDSARARLARLDGEVRLSGLDSAVEVRRDRWGVPHIYARTSHDVFFAQGYVVAQDRLWQMELWRRAGEGRLAEVLGPSFVERDRTARLLKYRGDMEAEWRSYADDARSIIRAFVAGVNARIAEELFEDHGAVEHADLAAVFGPRVENMIAGDNAPGAGHVCHRESRVTRDEASEMAGENPRIHVSTAARRKTDNDAHDFAAIEIRYPTVIDIRAAALRRQSRSCRAGEQETHQCCNRNPQFSTPPPYAAM